MVVYGCPVGRPAALTGETLLRPPQRTSAGRRALRLRSLPASGQAGRGSRPGATSPTDTFARCAADCRVQESGSVDGFQAATQENAREERCKGHVANQEIGVPREPSRRSAEWRARQERPFFVRRGGLRRAGAPFDFAPFLRQGKRDEPFALSQGKPAPRNRLHEWGMAPSAGYAARSKAKRRRSRAGFESSNPATRRRTPYDLRVEFLGGEEHAGSF